MSLRNEVIRIFNELLSSGKKITQLPNAGAITGNELIEAIQNGDNVKILVSDISSGGSSWVPQGDFDAGLGMPISTAAYQTWRNIAVINHNINGADVAPGDIVVSLKAAASSTVVDFEFVDWKVI